MARNPEYEQLDLPFESSFRLQAPINNLGYCMELVVLEKVPGWLEGHSSDHVHGETHAHFDACTWASPDESEPIKDGPGYIYFIENTHDSLIKIGKSLNPSKRLKELQTGSGFELRLIAQKYCSKMLKMEQHLHKKFEEDQMEGEWFLPSSGLLEYIGGL
jgi:hypothetical protein